MEDKTVGRLAGLSYLGLIVTGGFNLLYVPSKIFVRGDYEASYDNLLAHEELFRWGVVSGFVGYFLFLLVGVLLWRLFHARDRIASTLLLALVAISIPLSYAALGAHVEITAALGNDIDRAAGAALLAEKDSVYRSLINIAEIFWGLWLFPLAFLIVKTRMIPRIIAPFLILEGALYIVNYFGPVISPGYSPNLIPSFVSTAGSLSEVSVCLWLLIMGPKIYAEG